MNARQMLYLQQMGIEVCVTRAARASATAVEAAAEAKELGAPTAATDSAAATAKKQESAQTVAATAAIDHSAWQKLEEEVRHCTKCALCKTRTQTVFGSGHTRAEWLLIGEAPGFEEDRQGLPFVGPAGQLLTKMLRAIGLEREEVYIANILKCRPPDNRNPRVEEIHQCVHYLQRQIDWVQPQIILLLGGVAACALLGKQSAVSRLRLQVHQLPNIAAPVVVTYHPAYLLRSPHQKKAAWQDLQFACRTIGKALP